MQTNKQSAVVFMRPSALPGREEVEQALADLEARLTWETEFETEHTLALRIQVQDQEIAVASVGRPLPLPLYRDQLLASGLPAEDQQTIEEHGSHIRVISLANGAATEPVERMGMVYRIAARLCVLGGVAVLAPGSGVFVLGLLPEHVDRPLAEEVPPLDLWVQVEQREGGIARTAGTAFVGLPEVELHGVEPLEPQAIFATTMDVLLYLRRIRRGLIPGEHLHVGAQTWQWRAEKASPGVVVLTRTESLAGCPAIKA